jgi:membrane fusion protein (multidrug efflux system)
LPYINRNEPFSSFFELSAMASVVRKLEKQPISVVPSGDSAPPALVPAARAPVAEAPAMDVAARPPRKSVLKPVILGLLVMAGLALAANYGWQWWQVGRFLISTNDAYVQTDMAQLGAKVAGYVKDIPAAENTMVKAGDVVLRLDDGDYQLAVAAAKAKIETQRATIAGIGRQIDAQLATVAAAQSRLASAEAQRDNALANDKRTTALVSARVASPQTLDSSTLAKNVAIAAVDEAQAGIAAAQAQTEVLKANQVQAERALDELNTALSKAQRDLSFTEVRAPFDGVVANRAVEPGQFVQAGTRLMALVPSHLSYIEANFKETQIADVHPGQKATITVDALGKTSYSGQVVSLAPASGAEFSLLPPENATGNFTKITQRIPVKIAVPEDLLRVLRAGLSVSVTVDTRDHGQASP